MRAKRKTNSRRSRKNDLTDLEVAKKMIKIFQSAVDRKLEFDLSFNTVKKLLQEPKCYYTDKKFEESGVYARSFDRVDSDLGYVEGNVVACTVDINSKKSNLTFEEIETLYRVLSESQPKNPKEKPVEPQQESAQKEEEVKT